MKTIKDSERYFKSFVQEVKDYKDLTIIEFYMKYCIGYYGNEVKKNKQLYTDYIRMNDNIDTEELLSYKEWLEEVYFTELEEEINEIVREYRESSIEVITYKEVSGRNDYKIYEVTLAYGGPNIYINLSSRWNRAIYEFYWGGDNLKEDLSYMYDDIFNYLNLETYDYE